MSNLKSKTVTGFVLQFSILSVCLILLNIDIAFSQTTVVKGKITDVNSGDPIPFANVVFKGTLQGITSDFEGFYKLETDQPVDSLSVSYIGYEPKNKAVKKGVTQTINFQLNENVTSLEGVVVTAGENPAYAVLRDVVKNKNLNNKRKLDAYQYETYTKIEIDVDNMSEKFRNKKFMKKVTQVMDSVERIAGEDGKPILPMFISESISEYYFRSNPKLQHEKIKKTKITGVGVEDGSIVSQFIGSSFQEYNFYQNWLNLVGKEFVSPIADGWRLYYDYDLTDSLDIGGDFCYRLDFFPRREQDLAFFGTIWITKKEHALKQIDATVKPSANLNYIEKIKIQQELEPTKDGPWIPVKNRVLVDVGEVTKQSAGLLAKFYTSNRNVVVNQPKDLKFYERPIVVAPDYKLDNKEDYWNEHRHEALSPTEVNVYKMIDTLKNIPVVKTYTEILKIAVNGYKKVGKLDIGPYLSAYSLNNIEGHRFQLGFRTNIDFSNKWIFGARLAYGTRDEEFKYKAFARHILSRDRWTTIGLETAKDIDQVGLAADDLLGNGVFLTATRFGTLIRPYTYKQNKISLERELVKGLTQKAVFRYRSFDPLYNFGYFSDPGVPDSPIEENFTTSEIILETRFAKDEIYVFSDNDRISLGTLKWPIVTLRYTNGLKGVLGSDFKYQKILLNIKKDFKLGFFGTSKVSLTGEKIFQNLPYPLLKAHIGNESLFFTTAAYNLMNFSEFASDRYVSLKYNHHFQGFILNRIPLMRRLKWRLLATANVLYGELGEGNVNQIPLAKADGTEIDQIGALGHDPYLEVGYGVENIFKVLRVDAIHRLSYTNRPDVKNFGVKISFQFIL